MTTPTTEAVAERDHSANEGRHGAEAARTGDIVVRTVGFLSVLDSIRIEVGGRTFHVDCRTDDPTDEELAGAHVVLFFNKAVHGPLRHRVPRERRVAVLSESPIDTCYRRLDVSERLFPVLYTHIRSVVARSPQYRFCPFGTNWMTIRTDEATERVLAESPAKTGNVSFIGSLAHARTGAYSLRHDVAETLVSRPELGVDCYGRGIRPVDDKRDAIRPYRFSVAMENAAVDHYFSEKLIDCLLMETVPVYYGCPGIGELFDIEGFVPFGTVEELIHVLPSLTPERYAAMRPAIAANKRTAIANRWHNHENLLRRVIEDWAADPELLTPAIEERPIGEAAIGRGPTTVRRAVEKVRRTLSRKAYTLPEAE